MNYHRVNPLVFLSLYAVKTVTFWWFVVLIVQRARQRRWDSIPGLVLATMAFNVLPWLYVWLCGENLPRWYPLVVYYFGGYGLIYLAWYVRKKLRELPDPGPVLPHHPED